ncbi:hypothetical protein ACS0TY_005203 [Phlomoides rotata]
MYTLKDGVQDRWKWIGSTKERYNTADAYISLDGILGNNQIDAENEKGFKLIWNKFAPLKCWGT